MYHEVREERTLKVNFKVKQEQPQTSVKCVGDQEQEYINGMTSTISLLFM